MTAHTEDSNQSLSTVGRQQGGIVAEAPSHLRRQGPLIDHRWRRARKRFRRTGTIAHCRQVTLHMLCTIHLAANSPIGYSRQVLQVRLPPRWLHHSEGRDYRRDPQQTPESSHKNRK
jgi:hypothetical protein